MRRALTLRQIDIFRALIETGTVSRAAELLGISQPAASKLLSNLEADSNLRLFDRNKGRLVPTAIALQLYEEVEKVFSGVGQIEKVIDALHRREQERLTVGVIPALGSFITQAVRRFAERHPDVAITVELRGSRYIAEWIGSRRVDIGMISEKFEVPYLRSQTLLRRELVCAMPPGHPLAEREYITAQDLRDVPVISYSTLNQTQQMVQSMFDEANIQPHCMLEVTTVQMICEFIAAGMGLAVMHPLAMGSMRDSLVTRPVRPAMRVGYQLCWFAQHRNTRLIEAFSEDIIAVARDM